MTLRRAAWARTPTRAWRRSRVSLKNMMRRPKKKRARKEKAATPANEYQYVSAVQYSFRSLISTPKYPVMKLTGRKSTLSFASSAALRFSRAVACESFCCVRLKYCLLPSAARILAFLLT